MGNNKCVYEARRVCTLATEHPLPTFAQIVENVLARHKGQQVKREDIVQEVANAMECAVDKSISGAVSVELARLAEQGIVVQARKHGYWVVYK